MTNRYEDKGSKGPTARSRALRANMTDAERRLWSHLRARQVADTRFNSQFPMGPFTCDFVARTPKLVIEVDGGQHAEQEREDASRTAYLERRGYRVIRFWNNDVLGNLEGVVQAIEQVLADIPSPNPSRKREGSRTADTRKPPSRLREGSSDPPSRLREEPGEGLSNT